MNWLDEYLYKQYPFEVVKRTAGGTFFQTGKNEQTAVFTGHSHNYWDAGEWKPITLKADGRGNFEGIPFGYNQFDEITYKGRVLSKFDAVMIDGKKIQLKYRLHENALVADLPFGQARIVFTDTGVSQYLSIPEKMSGELVFIEKHARTPFGIIRGMRQTVDGLLLGSRINLDEMAFPLVIDPDYSMISPTYTVDGISATYATARATSTGFSTNTANGASMVIGQGVSTFVCSRGFYKFDTSDIFGTITQANITTGVQSDGSAINDWDIEIIEQDWSAQDPITAGNREAAYDACLAASVAAVFRNTSGIALNTLYTSPNLTAGYVKKQAPTYYSVRSSRDKAASAPTAFETARWGAIDLGGANFLRAVLTAVITPHVATVMPVLST